MDSTLQALLSSGKALLLDTKQRKMPPTQGKPKPSRHTIAEAAGVVETDPHRIFIRKATDEKPSKEKMVEEFKQFIKAAEDAL